ncbi:MAG: TonB-dependent siderophore receptor [Pseudomonadota bacterium]
MRQKYGQASLLGMALLGLATAVAAQENAQAPEMEEVLVTGQLSRFSALKSDTPIMEAARSISIETEQQIIDKGALTLDDTFTYSAGVIGETFGFATRVDSIRVRGLDAPQYQDSLQSLFGNFNNTRPHIYTLEQVEILKGPVSVLYGQGSPGGIVNVVSKRPREEAAHEIVLEAGNFDHTQLALDSTAAIDGDGRWLYRFVGVYRDSGTQVDEVDYDQNVLAPSLSFRPTELTDITLLLNWTETDSDTAAQFLPIAGTLLPGPDGRDIDSSVYLGEPDFNFYDATTEAVSLLVNHQFNAVWSMELTSRYTEGEVEYQQAWPSFAISQDRFIRNADGSLYRDGMVPRTWFGQEASSRQKAIDLRFRADFATGPLDHNVLIGTQYQDVTTDTDGFTARAVGFFTGREFGDAYWINVFDPVYGSIPPQDFLDGFFVNNDKVNSEDLGFYLHDQVGFGNWRITVGLRYDETENVTARERQKDDATSVSLGALYTFDNGLAPYVNYAESFEPTIGESRSGKALVPREGEQVEIGIKYQPSNFPALLTLAWYQLEENNLPDPLGFPGEFEQQSGVTEVEGIEFEGLAVFGDVTVELNLSHLTTESPDGWRLPSIPEDQASTFVTWRPTAFWSGFKAGLGVRYVGKTWDGIDNLVTPSYTLGDLLLGWEFAHWDLALNVRNVTDDDYQASCLARGDCFPGDQRTVVGRVAYRF